MKFLKYLCLKIHFWKNHTLEQNLQLIIEDFRPNLIIPERFHWNLKFEKDYKFIQNSNVIVINQKRRFFVFLNKRKKFQKIKSFSYEFIAKAKNFAQINGKFTFFPAALPVNLPVPINLPVNLPVNLPLVISSL